MAGKLLLLAVAALLLPLVALAELPPGEYKLDDFRLVVEHAMYTSLGEYQDSTAIGGNGEARYEESDGKKKRSSVFRLDVEIVKKIVRDLYELHFFDLIDDYTARPIVQFGDNATVTSIESIATHQWNTSVTVEIGSYTKTVRYNSHGIPPAGLREFVDQFEDLLSEYVPGGGEQWR